MKKPKTNNGISIYVLLRGFLFALKIHPSCKLRIAQNFSLNQDYMPPDISRTNATLKNFPINLEFDQSSVFSYKIASTSKQRIVLQLEKGLSAVQ